MLLACAAGVSGCVQGLTAAGAVLAGAGAVYQNAGVITGALDRTIAAACHAWELKHAAASAKISVGAVAPAEAARAAEIALYAKAACDPNNPPPAGDPLETVFWLAEIAVEEDHLTRTPSAAAGTH